jgi:hypothetical protein
LPGGKIEAFESKNSLSLFSLLRSCWNLKHQQLCNEIHTCRSYGMRSFGQLAISPTNKNLLGEKLKLLSQKIPSPFFLSCAVVGISNINNFAMKFIPVADMV